MPATTVNRLEGLKIGVAITGSFCTFSKLLEQLEQLKACGADLYPILSYHAATLDSRFGTAAEHRERIEAIANRPAITTIPEAEPFGPKLKMDVMVILPCTGNTLSKLANAITDTPVLMAAKAHLRNNRPLILAIASNDALGLSMKHLGLLMNAKNIYFVPYGQDDYETKPNSMIAHVDLLCDTIVNALDGRQLQPVIQSPFA
jgi:dipicolinate synthase subunit B